MPRLEGAWATVGHEMRWSTREQLAADFSERNGAAASDLPPHARTCACCGNPSERICVLKAESGDAGGATNDNRPTTVRQLCPSCVADEFLEHQRLSRGEAAVSPPGPGEPQRRPIPGHYRGAAAAAQPEPDPQPDPQTAAAASATVQELETAQQKWQQRKAALDASLLAARELLAEALTLEKEDASDWESSPAFADCEALAVSMRSRGNAAFKSRKWDEALQLYIDTIALDPRSAEAAPCYSNLAATLCQLGCLTDAADAARASTELDPRWAKGWWRRGEVARLQKEWKVSQMFFGRALELKPSSAVFAKSLAAIEKPLAASLIRQAALEQEAVETAGEE